VEKRRETHCICSKEKEKRIRDHVERNAAVARKRVADAETAIKQKQKEMRNTENT